MRLIGSTFKNAGAWALPQPRHQNLPFLGAPQGILSNTVGGRCLHPCSAPSARRRAPSFSLFLQAYLQHSVWQVMGLQKYLLMSGWLQNEWN